MDSVKSEKSMKAELIREEIRAGLKRAEMCVAEIEHKKADAGFQMSVFTSI